MEDRRTRAARTHFDRWSRSYETDASARWLQEVQTEALAALALSSGDVLLDLACGTGAAVRAAAPHVRRAVGFDLSPGMIAQARERADGLANVEFHEGDVSGRLPFAAGEFTALDAFGTLSVPREALSDTAVAIAASLASLGFRVIALVSIHGGNAEAMSDAVQRFQRTAGDARACAPRGDVGPNPGRHSGGWLTSVMLAFHADLVDMHAADPGLSSELETADAQRGKANFDRFVSSIVEQIRSQL